MAHVGSGDLNGDGYDDLLGGVPFADGAANLKSSAGEAWLVLGQASRLPASTDLASPPATATVVYGPDASDDLGYSVAVGDLDGDGIDDLIVGAVGADGPGNTRGSSGEAWIVSGQSSQLPAAIDLFSPPAGASVIYAPNTSDQLGFRNSLSAGDVNGDGYDDLLLGAYGGDGYPGQVRSLAGEVWVVYGRAASLPGSTDLALPPANALAIYGADVADDLSAVSAGDMNGDGLDDMILGAPIADAAGNGKLDAGEVHVVNGFPTTTYWNKAKTPSFIDATAGGTNLNLACDDCSATVPIGFVFPFYGEKWSTLYVSSNGFVSFAPINNLASAAPRCIDAKGPAATSSLPLLVCPFWDDLDLRTSGSVYTKLEGTAPDRRLTIEWLNVPHYPNTGAATFEVTLYESTGQILYQYTDLDFGNASYNNGESSVVGVQNRTGAEGTPYNCSQTLMTGAPIAISFNPNTPLWKDNMEGVDPTAATPKPGKWTIAGNWRSLTAGCSGAQVHTASRSLYDATSGFCTYANNANDQAVTPNIPSFPSDGRVSFWQRFQTEPVNGFGLFSTVGTGPLTTLLNQNGIVAGGGLNQPGPYFLGSSYSGFSVGFNFTLSTNASIIDFGWMVDDVRVVGCNAVGITSLIDPRAYAATTIYCGNGVNTGTLDAVGSRCGDGSNPTGYQWLENGVPISGATSVTYTIPASHAAGTFDFAVTVTCAAGSSTSAPQQVTIVAPPQPVGNTLLLTKQSGGADVHYAWTDVSGASDYVLFSDTAPNGSFATQVGTASSGTTGITIPMPSGSLIFYKVAGRNPTCGVGPL